MLSGIRQRPVDGAPNLMTGSFGRLRGARCGHGQGKEHGDRQAGHRRTSCRLMRSRARDRVSARDPGNHSPIVPVQGAAWQKKLLKPMKNLLSPITDAGRMMRDAFRPASFDDLSRDVRYGLRALRLAPGFTVVSSLTLALSIGAATTVFSVVNGVLIKPLPYPDAERLISIWNRFGVSRQPRRSATLGDAVLHLPRRESTVRRTRTVGEQHGHRDRTERARRGPGAAGHLRHAPGARRCAGHRSVVLGGRRHTRVCRIRHSRQRLLEAPLRR